MNGFFHFRTSEHGCMSAFTDTQNSKESKMTLQYIRDMNAQSLKQRQEETFSFSETGSDMTGTDMMLLGLTPRPPPNTHTHTYSHTQSWKTMNHFHLPVIHLWKSSSGKKEVPPPAFQLLFKVYQTTHLKVKSHSRFWSDMQMQNKIPIKSFLWIWCDPRYAGKVTTYYETNIPFSGSMIYELVALSQVIKIAHTHTHLLAVV